MVYILVTRIGPSFLKRTGHMTISRFGPLLAIAGAACLLAWTPQGRVAGAGPDAKRTSGPAFASADLAKPASCDARSTLSLLPPLARYALLPRAYRRLPEATRRSRSNSPTPTLKAQRRRLARCRQSRRPQTLAALEPSGAARWARSPPRPRADPVVPSPAADSRGGDPVQEGRRPRPHGARLGGH